MYIHIKQASKQSITAIKHRNHIKQASKHSKQRLVLQCFSFPTFPVCAERSVAATEYPHTLVQPKRTIPDVKCVGRNPNISEL